MAIAPFSSAMDGSWTSSAAPLETPVPLVDLDRLERNLDRMTAYAALHGLALRPHTKTHKSPRIAAEQLRRGAIGLTCATPREAEVMATVCDDLLLAYPPVGGPKLQRLMTLPDTVELTVALDSVQSAEQLALAAREKGRQVGVYIELDLGMHRTGIPATEEMLSLARAVAERPPLALGGEPPGQEGDGYGALLDRPGVTVQRLSEEHGILDLLGTDWRPVIGEQVRIVPNHACIVVHLHEMIYGIRGDRVESSWPVAARGRRRVQSSVEV